MKKAGLVLAALVVTLVWGVQNSFCDEVSWEGISRDNINLKAVLVDYSCPQVIYVGSNKGALKSQDAGVSWRNVLVVRGDRKDVNFLLFDPKDKNSIYAATASGLFFSSSSGKNWKRIFKGKNSLENDCTALAVLPYGISLGTKAGLFITKDKGRSWHKTEGRIGNSQILSIAWNPKEPNIIYLTCAEGAFKTTNNGESWERVFVSGTQEIETEEEESSDDFDEISGSPGLRYISIDPNNSNNVYLASSKGVYRSTDKGKAWGKLSSYGLLSRDTKTLLILNTGEIFVTTKSGIFEYVDGRWQEKSLRLMAKETNFLAMDKKSNLYAACDSGLFKASLKYAQGHNGYNNQIIEYKNEPKIKDVQDAAIKYAEVQPEKIIEWRHRAGKKAFLPELSVSLDRNSGDLWHWETGSTTKNDDDCLRRGRDSLDWGIDLKWDLSEIIWNEDQTAIDVRSRLMVQLRGDILDEVTKLYYERLRVKMDIDNLSIEDKKKRTEKELRIEELTASIDALTGGYFSKNIKESRSGLETNCSIGS